MGPTGAGKSIQAKRLAQLPMVSHLSSGELLRKDPTDSALLASGELVASDEVERIVEVALGRVSVHHTIILDGFPRVLDEAAWLDGKVSAWGRKITRVILFEVSEEVSRERLATRQRADDLPAALAAKWREYHEQTMPVIEHYKALGLLTTVDGAQSMETIYDQIRGYIA